MDPQNDSEVRDNEAADREELLRVTITRDELDRLYLVGGIAAFLLLGVLRKGKRHDREIARLMAFASETAKYLEAKEAADALFAKRILEHIITNKGA